MHTLTPFNVNVCVSVVSSGRTGEPFSVPLYAAVVAVVDDAALCHIMRKTETASNV